ncbi:MAG: lyase family protein, partial [Oscillospiraceae bacterium]|nr:lyase family protein [Oscillospiraceae bacterium]
MPIWQGRFSQELDEIAARLNNSLPVDHRLWRDDIAGSVAHARMLGECGVISKSDSEKIIGGLNTIKNDIESGELEFDFSYEDIHSFIEGELTRRIGPAGGRLHTARSRNDQVATDLRLF